MLSSNMQAKLDESAILKELLFQICAIVALISLKPDFDMLLKMQPFFWWEI